MTEQKTGFFTEIVETLITSFIVLMVIYWTVALPEVVIGASMEPTFYSGERILVERITKYLEPYERGDVVVLHPPGDDNVDYIKRIIGVEGDVVKVLDCKVYISRDGNRFKLEEPYLYEGICTQEGPKLKEGRSLRIEEDQFLVLGDNRNKSADSRSFGLIEEGRILGKVVFRFWPFNKVAIY